MQLVLIIDDEPNILNALYRTLSSEPYMVKCTTHPQEALDILRTENVDVFIADQRMPDITGMDLLIKAKQLTPTTARILLTGYSEFEVLVSAINEGCLFHYISKPWDNEQLKDIIAKAICWKKENTEKEYILQQTLTDADHWFQTVSHLQNQLTDIQQRIIQATLRIVELKDPGLYSHSVRTAALAVSIAQSFCHAKIPDLENIRLVGLFHDIGKITIKDEVFYSGNKLSEGDYHEMKRHPAVGREILQALGVNEAIIAIVHQHHERLDGTGYPQGLAKDQILVEAKILAVADVYDALTSDRSYRKGMNHQEACNILLTELNSHYDFQIVNVLLEVVGKKQ